MTTTPGGSPHSGKSAPLAIVNPRSGGGHAARTAPVLRQVLERHLGSIDVVLTERPAHAIEVARDAARDGRSLVIAVGGDGTLHEVANGVLDAGGSTAVAYVGQGTGGDFRRTFGIEHRLDLYAAAIARGREQLIDVGRVRYRAFDGTMQMRFFVNILSMGLGGLVDANVSRTTKVLGGRAAYMAATLRALARCRRGRLRCSVSLEGSKSSRRVETLMMAICNGRYFGGGMHVAPMAKPDDGRFEVVSLDSPSKLGFVLTSRSIYSGTHLSSPGTVHFPCDALEVELENEDARDVFLLDVDGEALGGLPVQVDLVPRALKLRM